MHVARGQWPVGGRTVPPAGVERHGLQTHEAFYCEPSCGLAVDAEWTQNTAVREEGEGICFVLLPLTAIR
jgi:hypothetical protein